MEKAYKNLGYVMILLIPLSILGFYMTYFGQFPDFKEHSTALSHSSITIAYHFHAFMATLWIFFLILQPLLIRYGRIRIHKGIGKISYVVFPLLILSFILLIFNILNADHPLLAYLPISDAVTLILFYLMAIIHRKKTPIHMRYMIGTALIFLGPIIGRVGPAFFGLKPDTTNNIHFLVVYLILFALILLDRKNGRNFRPYVVILAASVVNQIVFNIIL